MVYFIPIIVEVSERETAERQREAEKERKKGMKWNEKKNTYPMWIIYYMVEMWIMRLFSSYGISIVEQA